MKSPHPGAALLIVLVLAATLPPAHAQGPSLQEQADRLHLMRREKLDRILPGAMRDNDIDMWIQAIRMGHSDPMQLHFGPVWGYVILSDRGGERIERALFGSGGHPDLFDHFGSREVSMALEGYEHGTVDPSIYDEIRDYVHERRPRRIAINTSDWLAIADGMSHTQYRQLVAILGEDYAARFVPADRLITDFRSRRTQSEIAEFARALEIHRQILLRALSREVITPGITTLGDVGRWVNEERHRQGVSFGPDHYTPLPRILYSAQSEPTEAPDVRWLIHNEDYAIQRGDFMTYDISVRHLGYFSTDYKRNAYVFREGETEIPASIQRAFDRAIRAREIMHPHIVAGRSAKETLDALVAALEDEGYVYTPFIDIGTEDYKMIQKALAKTDRPGFSIDLHAMGNNGGSLLTVGASVAPFRKDRFDLVIQENELFSFEYMVHSRLEERPGLPVSINIEGNHVVTDRGVEYLHPRNEKILEIR